MCLEYYWWRENNNDNSKDDKWETLLCGDSLGICHKWDFGENWHYYQYKAGSIEPMGNLAIKEEIEKKFLEDIDKQFEQNEKNKKSEKNRLKMKMTGQGVDQNKEGEGAANQVAKPEIAKR